jgi:hypothetical protein
MVDLDFPLVEFTADDRCDRCGAQAYTLAKHDEYGELLFCLHHRKNHADTLIDEGWTVVDDYEAISRLADNNHVYAAPV